MILITGDTHWSQSETQRFRSAEFRSLRKTLTKDDYLIIAGDFGLIWEQALTKEERYWIDWLTNAQWTTLFVDGNHENFDRLNNLSQESRFGGKVGVVSDSVFHLRRGEVYEIEGKKILAFGGAKSNDISSRKEGKSWWKDELPTNEDLENALRNLSKHDFKVDMIVSHTCPKEMASELAGRLLASNVYGHSINTDSIYSKFEDTTTDMLQSIADKTSFNRWFFGHWHTEVKGIFEGRKYQAVYKSVTDDKGEKLWVEK